MIEDKSTKIISEDEKFITYKTWMELKDKTSPNYENSKYWATITIQKNTAFDKPLTK